MTDAQTNFVSLEKRKSEYKEWLEELGKATQAVADELGIGNFFQDEEKTVYKIVTPVGRWVQFETISYLRTKRADEQKGSLSVKEAKEKGFEV